MSENWYQNPYIDRGDDGGQNNWQGSVPNDADGNLLRTIGNAYVAYRTNDMPPQWEAPMSDFQRWGDENLSSLYGAAGPIKAVKTGTTTALRYYPKGTPDTNVKGELVYSQEPKEAPLFEMIWAQSPRATAEMLGALEKRLGPTVLDQMQLTPMLPEAIPFWDRLASSNRLQRYPNLQNRIRQGVEDVRQTNSANIPSNSYQNNPYKEGHPFDFEDITPSTPVIPGESVWNRITQSLTPDELRALARAYTEGQTGMQTLSRYVPNRTRMTMGYEDMDLLDKYLQSQLTGR